MKLSVRIFFWSALFFLTSSAIAATRNYETEFFQSYFGDLRAELAAARNQGKKGILLVYEQEECPFCYRFHNTILNQSQVQEFFRSHFRIYQIDIRGSNAIIGFDGRETIEKDFSVVQRVRATPTSIFYGLDGKEMVRFSGVAKDVAEFMLLGSYVVEGVWRRIPFTKFKMDQQAR